MAPTLEPILAWATRYGTEFVRENPKYMCVLNGWIVETGEAVVHRVLDGRGRQSVEEWRGAGNEVERFCALVDEWLGW